MSIEETAPTRTGIFTHPASTSTLQACPDLVEKLPVEIYARPQERSLAVTYQHAGVGIVEVDAEGKLLRGNAQACALTGYPLDELLGRSIFDLTIDDCKVRFMHLSLPK